jgi:DNA-binding beta-propeller fold protein YncE
MFRRGSLAYRFGLPVLGSVIILAGLTTLGVDLASPSDAQAPSFRVLPPSGSTFNDPVAVSSDGTHVWVANKRGNSVTELGATTGALVQAIQGPSYGFDSPDAISSNGTDVWVANALGNSVTELDASTGALVQVISAGTSPSNPSEFSPSGEFDYPTAICPAGTHVWVLNSNYYINSWSFTELDASTGAVVQVIQGPDNATTAPYMGMSCDGTHVWVTNSGYWTGQYPDQQLQNGFVTELDASTGAVVQVISSSSLGIALPDGVSSDGTDVWVANLGGASVAELNASTGALVQVISLSAYGNAAEYISSDGTHVWVRINNNLVELHASTGAFVQEFSEPSDGSYADYQKLSSDGTHLWVVNSTNQSVTELDASTGALVQVVPVNAYGFDDPLAVSSDGTHVWVANMQSGSVSELDASTGALVQVLSGPSYDFGFGDFSGEADAISSDGIHVWVANSANDSVTELDASTGALVQVISGSSVGLKEPFAVSSDGTHVWVTDRTNNSVTELAASTGALVRVRSDSTYGFNFPSGVSSDGTHVWVANLDGSSVTELNANTSALVHVTKNVYAVAISSDGTHVWAVGGGSVTEFDASTGAIVRTISPSGLEFPQSISSDGTDVWVASTGDNSVIELDASTGALVQVISGSSYGLDWPTGISSDGTAVWVTNEYGNSVTALSKGVLAQRIIFTSTPPSKPLFGGPSYTVSAIGGASGNPVRFSIDPSATSVCSISGQTVSFNAPGTCIIDANQGAGNGYVAAPQAQQSFVVGAQDITFTSTPPSNGIVGGPAYTVSATGGASGNPVTFSIDPSATSDCSISGQTVSFDAAGTCIIDANQAAGNGYAAAPQAQQSFVVGAQTITFTSTPPYPATVGGPSYTVTATGGGSGNPVTFSSDDPSDCTVSGSTVSFVGASWCDIVANQAGNADWLAAPTATQSFLVGSGGSGGSGGSQHINFTSTPPFNVVVGASPYMVTAAGGGSGNPVTFSSESPSVCSVSGSTVSFVGASWCTIAANQAGNADYSAAPTAIQSFLVGSGGSGGSGGFVVTTTSVPNATAGVRYTAFQLQASGAPTPYKWKLTGGALPRGLHLQSKGVLAGKPIRHDAAGTYTFMVEAVSHHRHPLQTTPPETLTLTLQS